MRPRLWHILLIGMGSLVLLTILSGLSGYRQGQQIYTTILGIHEDYTRREAALDDLRSGVYLSSLLVRDYLLDPSHITALMHREELVRIREEMSRKVEELGGFEIPAERRMLQQLRKELDAYWDTMDPVFEWTPRRKLAISSLFLRREVLPRRTAVLEMAEEISRLNVANFRQHQRRIDRSLQEFRRYTIWTLAVIVLLGLLVAGASALQLARLEKRADEHHRATERAERELRRLSLKLVRAQEDERRRISRELHDEVGQMLTGLRFELANLEAIRTGPEEPFKERMQEAKGLAEKTLRAVRDMAMGLRPSLLDDLGLGPALEWQIRDFSRRTGIPVELVVEGPAGSLPDTHRTCVYRVIQEAFTNCARHARARHIRVAVHVGEHSLAFTVQDDGVGFRRGSQFTPGLGLISIEERVRELGGKVEIRSQPGRGTLLQAEIPLRPEPESAARAETEVRI
ncbi:MAG: histidine kinase [Bryobacterales bacterium]|nr:histidine kinase [Bryobacterales bacterium]